MYRFLGLVIALSAAPAASAKSDCVDLDGAARICPAEGAYNLDQGDNFWAGIGIADPDTGLIGGVGIEVADGCHFAAFTGERPTTACSPGSLDEMKQRWAEAFESADSKENGGIGRRKLIDIVPMNVGGYSGHMARYRSDYSFTNRYSDIWEAVFMTEVNGRHFLFTTMDISDSARFAKMAWRIRKAISFIQFTDGNRE